MFFDKLYYFNILNLGCKLCLIRSINSGFKSSILYSKIYLILPLSFGQFFKFNFLSNIQNISMTLSLEQEASPTLTWLIEVYIRKHGWHLETRKKDFSVLSQTLHQRIRRYRSLNPPFCLCYPPKFMSEQKCTLRWNCDQSLKWIGSTKLFFKISECIILTKSFRHQ